MQMEAFSCPIKFVKERIELAIRDMKELVSEIEAAKPKLLLG